MRLHQAKPLPEFFFFTDDSRRLDPLAVARRLPAGSGIIFRHYDSPERDELAARLARIARQRRLVLLVAGDWRLAARMGADGVHWPEHLARHGVGVRSRRRWLVTAAAHSPAALARAKSIKADAAFLSPVFPTESHPGAPTLGPLRFALISRAARLPVLALGGIGKANARRLRFAAGTASASMA